MHNNARMSPADFNRLSQFIREHYGIHLPPAKKFLLESRLQTRLRALGFNGFHDYCAWVLTPAGHREEGPRMMDLVTTNKTDFFREPHHFQFLETHVLPALAAANRTLKVWSAGCSSGEEPYTLAMVLEEFAENHPLPGGYSVYATDLSGQVLEEGRLAVYPEDRIADIPAACRQKYLLRSKAAGAATVRIAPHLRGKVHFERLNLLQENYDAPRDFDVVFCRNVLIYFDKPTQERVIRKLCGHLRKGGFFFLGHSESTMNMDVPLRQLRPTVFQKL